MSHDVPLRSRATLGSRRFKVLFLSSALLGGVIAAILDVTALHQGVTLAYDLFGNVGGTAQKSTPRISVSWFYGLLQLGEVDHPYLWAGIGGFLMGAIAGAVLFLVVYGLVALFRKRLPGRAEAERI